MSTRTSRAIYLLVAMVLLLSPLKASAWDGDCDADDGYYPPAYSYGAYPQPYYGPNIGLVQQQRGLIYADQSARAQYYAALQRGDRQAAKHLYNAIRKDEQQLRSVQAQLGAQGSVYATTPPFVDPGYFNGSYGYQAGYNGYGYLNNNYQAGYNGYPYGYPSANGNANIDAAASVLVPLVQQMFVH